MQTCPNCQQPISPGETFCLNCGTDLPPSSATAESTPPSTAASSSFLCPDCGAKNAEGALLCSLCGASFQATNADNFTPHDLDSSEEDHLPAPAAPSTSLSLGLLGLSAVVFLGLIYGLYSLIFAGGPVRHGPGIFAANPPEQENYTHKESFTYKGKYIITRLAHFDLNARVLAKERYYFDNCAELAPYDLAMGWGQMSDEQILDRVDISQRGRFYYWRVSNFPIPKRQIERSSANMHLIAANSSVANAIAEVRVGQIIHLTGDLVRVTGEGAWRWQSSLTRNDTGNGACEIIYVESFNVTKAGE